MFGKIEMCKEPCDEQVMVGELVWEVGCGSLARRFLASRRLRRLVC